MTAVACPPQLPATSGVLFQELLASAGVSAREHGPWLSVGAAEGVQGWKLHLSSIPTQAHQLLARVLPVLAAAGVPFKIARTVDVLGQLNEGSLGPTQVGKFMTIYPQSNAESVQLARELAGLTPEFSGPVIVTDRRLGQVVYTRYGNYNPIISRDRLGQISFSIYAPDGSLCTDGYQIPFTCPVGVEDIFDGFHATWRVYPEGQSIGKLFGPGYLIVETLRSQAKGSVYLAMDLRSQELVGPRVIKQGRRHTMSDLFGRDMRDRLRRQAYLHNTLANTVRTPAAGPYFELGGDGYLPLTWIEGQTIEKTAVDALNRRPWAEVALNERMRLLGLAAQLVRQVEKLHAAGYVHRDLTAGNVWVSAAGEIWLLDLELAQRVGDETVPFALGTPGFMSPNQERRGIPEFADDYFGLGAVLLLILTGMDPRRILFAPEDQRLRYLRGLTGERACGLLDVAVKAVSANPAMRPGLRQMLRAIESHIPGTSGARRRTVGRKALADITASGVRGLLHGTARDGESGVWLSPAIQRGKSHAFNGQFELRRGANRGVAGVVYLIGRLVRTGFPRDHELRRRVRQAARWLMEDWPTIDAGMPGLHFGEAGVSLALAEAVASGLIANSPKVRTYIEKGLIEKSDWPDITHGAAGQGLAAMECANLLGMPRLARTAARHARYLVDTQQPDGSWKMPEGVNGMSRQTLTGFAHGAAGMVYFLTVYGAGTSDTQFMRTAVRGAAWMESQATVAGDGLQWRYSDAQPECWTWWCHGAPGIALTFLKLFEKTGASRWRILAEGALASIPHGIRAQNLSQCHGLSGLGEIVLEAHRVLGGEEWKRRASSIAELLMAARRQEGNRSVWLVEETDAVTADLMAGCGGIIHFFHRLGAASKLGFPLL